ncbi:MAG TPA: FecR domain-containing protein, partial [Thermoanaerobaculia bacterium]
MAKKNKSNSADIDWYLISIDRLKQIGLVVLVLLLGFVGWLFWRNQKESPRQAAESAIAEARQALNTLAASPEFNAHRSEFARAQQRLDQAHTHLSSSRFREAQDAAVESNTISRAALSGGTSRDNDAQFLTVEGDVKFQKAASNDWKDAETRIPLFNGDWVKTGDRASAELIFSNGSLYTVGPNALLEIFSTVNPSTSEKTNAVQMRVGSVEVATSNDSSAVRTPGAQIVIESESTAQVGVDKAAATQVVATRGSSSVTPEKGGAAVRVAPGEKILADPQGTISPVKKLSPAPALLSPADGQVLQLLPNLTVEFLWGEQPGSTGYVLQVSRSRLFATQEINSRRTSVTASAKVTSEG